MYSRMCADGADRSSVGCSLTTNGSSNVATEILRRAVTGAWQCCGCTCRHHLWYGCSWLLQLTAPQCLTLCICCHFTWKHFWIILYRVIILSDIYLFSYPAAHLQAVTSVGRVSTTDQPVRCGRWLQDELMTLYSEQNNGNDNYYQQDDNADVISLKQKKTVSVLCGSATGSSRILSLYIKIRTTQHWTASSYILFIATVAAARRQSLHVATCSISLSLHPSCFPNDLLAPPYLTNISYSFSHLCVPLYWSP
jgi:hypothetical protein